MAERPDEIRREREETVQRRVVERDGVSHDRVNEVPPSAVRSGGSGWLWAIPLLLVVVVLLWYVLSRGEPTQIQVPDVELPERQAPQQPDQTIEINLPEPSLPSSTPEPAAEPAAEPASEPATEPVSEPDPAQ